MANIAISRICNLRCPYCFAEGFMSGPHVGTTAPFISVRAFLDRLDFLERSNMHEVRLIGGEPTLHPEFPELVRLARLRDLQVVVFSNGLMPEAALACLEALPPEKCGVLINMNASRAAEGPTEQETTRRHTTLRRLGPRALPGFTIHRPDSRLDPIVAAIEETGCQRVIRIGLAHPIHGAENQHLHPKQYPIVGHRLALFAWQAAQQGIRLEFDCGFVRCMFSPDDLDTLRRAGTDAISRCSPILDVDIAGPAVHCFPLTGVVVADTADGHSAQTLRDSLSAQTRPYRTAGIYRECSTCQFKEQGTCTGGCLAATLRRFRHRPFSVTISQAALNEGGPTRWNCTS